MAGPGRLSSLAGAVAEAARVHLPSGPAVVALSGGADSAVCAWVARELGSPVRTVFVDHGLPQSSAMGKAASEVADGLDLALDVVEISIPEGPSPEAQARKARYAALEEELDADEWLLTGHTADDQAETVLTNLIRGTGLNGLAGIAPMRGRIVRPLLSVWRRQTRELATLLGLGWRDDPDNFEERTPRNALRRSVLPSLEAAFNPSLREALVRMAQQAGRDHALLEEAAAKVPITVVDGEVRVPAPALGGLPLPTQERVLRRALRLVNPPYGGSEQAVRDALVVATGGGSRHLEGGVDAIREGPWLLLVRDRAPKAALEPIPWSFRGEVRFGDWTLEAYVDEALPAAYPLSPWRAVFDADLFPATGKVRAARRGDAIAMEVGRKSVRAALSEAEVPKRERDRWPVVTAGDDIVWIPGARRAQQNWVTLHTRRYLWMRAERESR